MTGDENAGTQPGGQAVGHGGQCWAAWYCGRLHQRSQNAQQPVFSNMTDATNAKRSFFANIQLLHSFKSCVMQQNTRLQVALDSWILNIRQVRVVLRR